MELHFPCLRFCWFGMSLVLTQQFKHNLSLNAVKWCGRKMNANWRFASAKVQNKLFISVSLEISHKICRGNEEHISFYWSIKYVYFIRVLQTNLQSINDDIKADVYALWCVKLTLFIVVSFECEMLLCNTTKERDDSIQCDVYIYWLNHWKSIIYSRRCTCNKPLIGQYTKSFIIRTTMYWRSKLIKLSVNLKKFDIFWWANAISN